MIIKQLNLTNFRNYDNLEIKFNKTINIIHGNNAQGKTNILEGIFVLCLTKSHRLYVDNNLIKHNEIEAHLKGIFFNSPIDDVKKMSINKNGKTLEINNNRVKKINDYIANSNIIIFYPEDLNLIKGSPQERRRYLNVELCQLYNNYIVYLNDYNKLLKMRNDYLKKIKLNENVDFNYFSILTNYLIQRAVSIYEIRKKYFDFINEIIDKIYYEISEYNNFKIVYKPSIDLSKDNIEELMKLEFKRKYNDEVRLGTTIIGPHKDDYFFMLDDENLKENGSQGQQRMAIIAYKLAEIKLFNDLKGEKPILLLDDVFSELDDIKKNLLLKYIDDDYQVIVTTTDLKNISKNILKKAKLIKICDGKIEEVQNGE